MPAGASTVVYWLPPRQHSVSINFTWQLEVMAVLTEHKISDAAQRCVEDNESNVEGRCSEIFVCWSKSLGFFSPPQKTFMVF